MKNKMNLNRTNEQIILNDEKAGAYNPTEWKRRVESYLKYNNVEFFQSHSLNEYNEYDYYVKYQLRDGLIFFSQISFTSCLHNGGFTRVILQPHENDSSILMFKKGFGENGNERVINNPVGRRWLRDNVCKYGVAVTNN